ncbi:MAG: HAMP domain-containing histidine kinase [Bdellovibrionales bacterium]|nr:HAMP domain-containing histidine kinase [Bdellovibrionales bacterium]
MFQLPQNLPQDLAAAFRGSTGAQSVDEALPSLATAIRNLLGAKEVFLVCEIESEDAETPREVVAGFDAGGSPFTAPTLDAVFGQWIRSGLHRHLIEDLSSRLACVSYSAFSWPYTPLKVEDVYGNTIFHTPREYTLLVPCSSRQAVTFRGDPAFQGYIALFFDAFPSLKDTLIELIIMLPGLLSQIAAQFLTRSVPEQSGELGAFAHDIKRYLLIVREFLRVAQSEDSARRAKAFSGIERSLVRMLHESNSLLLADRDSFGGLHIHPVPVQINELVEEAVQEMRPLFATARIKVRVELESSLPDLLIDPAVFPSVVSNLLDNALKYSDSGSEVIVRTALTSNDDVALQVVDSGVPVADEDLPHLFAKRYRGSNARAVSGNGLGLYLVKKIVEAHGGSVRLESGAGGTKRFVAELPAAHGQAR